MLINLLYFRSIQIYLSEKTLLLAAKHGNSNSGFLVGSFFSESGELKNSKNVNLYSAIELFVVGVDCILNECWSVAYMFNICWMHNECVLTHVECILDVNWMHVEIVLYCCKIIVKHMYTMGYISEHIYKPQSLYEHELIFSEYSIFLALIQSAILYWMHFYFQVLTSNIYFRLC